MPDFRSQRQIPTQTIIDVYGRSPQADMISSGLTGLQKGFELSESVRAIREKKQRAKAIAEMMSSPEMKQLVNESGIPAEMIKENPAVFIQGIMNARNRHREIPLEEQVKQKEELSAAAERGRTRENKPVFSFDPVNQVYKDGAGNVVTSVPRNSVIRNIQISPEAKLEIDRKKNLLAYSDDANQALVAIDKIERLSRQLGDFGRGGMNQAISKLSAGYKKFAMDKNMNQYLGVVSQELIPMSRKIMEEKGPITEFDVARVEKGLGNVTAPLEDKIFLLNELRNKIRQAIMNKNESAGISEEEFAKMKPEFYKKLISGIKPLQGQDNLRQQAIQELQSAGAPVTEANINEAMRQLGGQ